MDRYQRYVTGIGFNNPSPLRCKNRNVRVFRYTDFDLDLVRAQLNKPKKRDSEGRFVFVLSKDKVIRVDSYKKIILLGNGSKMVKAFLRSLGEEEGA